MRVWWSISIGHWPAPGASTTATIAAAHGWRARRSRATSRALRRKRSIASRFARSTSTARSSSTGRSRSSPATCNCACWSSCRRTRSRCRRCHRNSSSIFCGATPTRGISPIRSTAATATRWVGNCSDSRACPAANTGNWSPAMSRTTPNPSACSTSRPARCRLMRKAFRSTSSSSATARPTTMGNAEMSATKMKAVDFGVVGSGVVGSIMSMELASAGLKVVCLERGKQFDVNTDFHKPNVYDELKFDRHSDIFQNLARDTITFRNSDSQTALPMREMGAFKPGEMVGGTAAHWGGNARRFLPHDFEMRSRIKERYGASSIPEDYNLQDWGVTWDEIEPYYDQFEEIFGVGGKAGNLNGEIQASGDPYEGPRSREYPNPPTRRTYEGALFADAVSSLGYVPFQGPTAAMTQDYRNLYRVQMLECARGGFCSSHVCAQGAKANPLTSVLPALARQPNFELRPLCNVLRVNVDSSGKKATGVTYIDARGNEVEQPAGIVVLGAYCFSNVRLLLLSGIGTPYDPLTGKGVVGRNYSYQQGGSVQVFFADREFNPFIGGGQLNASIDELNGDVIDRGPLGFIGGAYVNTSARGAAPIKGKVVPPGTPRWGGEWKKAVAYHYRRNIAINSHGTCLSY